MNRKNFIKNTTIAAVGAFCPAALATTKTTVQNTSSQGTVPGMEEREKEIETLLEYYIDASKDEKMGTLGEPNSGLRYFVNEAAKLPEEPIYKFPYCDNGSIGWIVSVENKKTGKEIAIDFSRQFVPNFKIVACKSWKEFSDIIKNAKAHDLPVISLDDPRKCIFKRLVLRGSGAICYRLPRSLLQQYHLKGA